jgi:hypothetical protein
MVEITSKIPMLIGTHDVMGWLVVQVIALIVVFAQGFLGNLT